MLMLWIALLQPPAFGQIIVNVRPQNAQVTLDGRPITTDRPLDVAAGTHTLVISAPGHIPRRQRFLLDAGSKARFDIALERGVLRPTRRPEPTLYVTPPARRKPVDLRPVGIAFFIASAPVFMASGILGIITDVRARRFREARDYTRKVEQRDAAHSLAKATNITLGIGGALAATGFILFALNPDQSEQGLQLGPGSIGWGGRF